MKGAKKVSSQPHLFYVLYIVGRGESVLLNCSSSNFYNWPRQYGVQRLVQEKTVTERILRACTVMNCSKSVALLSDACLPVSHCSIYIFNNKPSSQKFLEGIRRQEVGMEKTHTTQYTMHNASPLEKICYYSQSHSIRGQKNVTTPENFCSIVVAC